MSTIQRQGAAAVEQLAVDLRQDGYRVVIDPGPGDLPEALHDVRPDLIASKGAETVVFEVKLRGTPPRTYEELARRVESVPGYSFRVFFAPDDDRDLDFPPPSEGTIRKDLATPADLFARGQSAAALLLAWSLFEAAARRRMIEDQSDPRRGVTPEGLVVRLVHLGYLDDDEASRLQTVARARNRIAHGDLESPVEESALSHLRAATEQLLAWRAAA